MRTREFGLVAVGRFIAVESYCQSHQSPSTHPLRGSGGDRTSGHASKQDRESGVRAPAQPGRG
jgi:hypothetical protein